MWFGVGQRHTANSNAPSYCCPNFVWKSLSQAGQGRADHDRWNVYRLFILLVEQTMELLLNYARVQSGTAVWQICLKWWRHTNMVLRQFRISEGEYRLYFWFLLSVLTSVLQYDFRDWYKPQAPKYNARIQSRRTRFCFCLRRLLDCGRRLAPVIDGRSLQRIWNKIRLGIK